VQKNKRYIEFTRWQDCSQIIKNCEANSQILSLLSKTNLCFRICETADHITMGGLHL